ncbi:ABC transporter permease [uncultured Eubacterium sp.]|uniref:ABC transporter permease n=1 Tax=uncultured Eubacterium sp. TaxID=165185 RepID=UPI0025D31E62|nr:ABC transporter permease [uncultured Eubacterium sp.]
MKNPLRKRLLRELKSEFGKYAVIFLLLAGTISFVSGFLVADGSMLKAYNEGFTKYNIEDGNFQTKKKMNKAQERSVQEFGITVYDNFYTERSLSNDTTLRVFENRSEVNTVCLMEGKMPETADEIAIDRMYADNNNLKVGDIISEKSGKTEIADNTENSTDETANVRNWKIVGLVALPDYSCLFSDNNDTMFDAVKFGVAIIPEGGLDAYSADDLVYDYSWKYDTKPVDDAEEKDMSEDLMKDLNGEVALQSFIPQYQNQAIHFTGDDMGGDRTMMIALLYIVIAILAFVFGITISNTISKEASVIGTLRASGYTKNELIRHYMAMPVIVTAISAVIGNILGYTVLKKVCAGMYYGSYSLPTYETIWSADAFVMTTIVPIMIMLLINYVVLRKKLQLGPLKFLRRDLSGKKLRKIVPLNPKLPFFSRFQIRVLFQNMSNYVVLFIGIIFANMLLMFGLLFPSILNHYQESIPKQMLCNYQYMLQVPIEAMDEEHKLESMVQMLLFSKAVETDNEDAEKFSAYSLEQSMSTEKKDGVTIYGVAEDSRYIPLDFNTNTASDHNTDGGSTANADNVPNVYVSSAYAEKYDLVIGDTISLKEPYGDDVYEFTVEGIYPYEAGIAVFMPQKELNQTFDLGDDYFCGYLSDTEITDIDEKYIGSVIDVDALTKISRQLMVSMGSMMYLVDGFAIVMFVVLIYLLSKIIIEKNAQSISMVKILGYTNREICRLYLMSTSVVVAAFLLISLPIETMLMKVIIKIVMQSMTGWISFYMDPKIYVEMFVLGICSYAVVAMVEYRRIRKVPMDTALKNVE